MCFSEVLSLSQCLLERKRKREKERKSKRAKERKKERKKPKRQSQIAAIQYDSEADPMLVHFHTATVEGLCSPAKRQFLDLEGFCQSISSGLLKGEILILCILQQQMEFPFRGFLNNVGNILS